MTMLCNFWLHDEGKFLVDKNISKGTCAILFHRPYYPYILMVHKLIRNFHFFSRKLLSASVVRLWPHVRCAISSNWRFQFRCEKIFAILMIFTRDFCHLT